MKTVMYILAFIFPCILFKYEGYRRYCKMCGQRQDLWSTNYSDCKNKTWWEDTGKIFDKNCVCHKFQIFLSSLNIFIF